MAESFTKSLVCWLQTICPNNTLLAPLLHIGSVLAIKGLIVVASYYTMAISMSISRDEIERMLLHAPEDVLKEVEEYEKRELSRYRVSGAKRRFPSNEDVVDAIKAVSGGVITRANIDHLFETVKKYLEDKGFDTRFLTEGRFWRLVTSLAKKGVLKLRL